MNLASLPSEILDLVVQSCPSSKVIISLWKSGDRLMQRRLTSGCRKVKLATLPGFDSHHPRVLSELRNLRHLSLQGSPLVKEDGLPESWSHFLSLLPSALESLEIQAFRADHILLSAMRPQESIELADLGQIFPSLQKLALYPSKHTSAEWFLRLPLTLTTLGGTIAFNYSRSQHYLSRFPQSLTRLEGRLLIGGLGSEVNHQTVNNDWLGALPLLTHLGSIESSNIFMQAFSHYEWLPRSLTECRILPPPIWTPQLAASLPPGLKSVVFAQMEGPSSLALIGTLPHHLTGLTFANRTTDAFSLGASEIALLPRTLTRIDAQGNDFDWRSIKVAWSGQTSERALSAWPPRLSILQVAGISKINVSDLDILPSTLTNLEIRVTWPEDVKKTQFGFPFNTSLLPPRLTRLMIDTTSRVFFQGTFPPNLGSLWLMGPYLTRESLASFPPSLTVLRCVEARFEGFESRATSYPLPEGLKILQLPQYPIDAFDLLPRSLTEFDSVVVTDYKLDLVDSGDLFRDLPPALEALNLRLRYRTPIAAIPQQRVPPSITRSLILQEFAYFPSTQLQELSPRLEKLTLRLTNLEAADALFIPPKLKTFNLLTNTPINIDIERYWPAACYSSLKNRKSEFLALRRPELCD